VSKIKKIRDLESLVYNLELEIKKTKVVLAELSGKKSKDAINFSLKVAEIDKENYESNNFIIEGVFNGKIMIGPDGKEYSVPANYASKSKLVEGDILKLTINNSGIFIFKQIAPVERDRLIGHLVKNNKSGEFVVLAGDKIYNVLLASITYFKGEESDEVVILVPKDGSSNWAAIENIIKNKSTSNYLKSDTSL